MPLAAHLPLRLGYARCALTLFLINRTAPHRDPTFAASRNSGSSTSRYDFSALLSFNQTDAAGSPPGRAAASAASVRH
jgi:hypothetical protein